MAVLGLLLVAAPAAMARDTVTARASVAPAGTTAARDGVRTLTYKFGPIPIKPGQNDIALQPNDLKPAQDGWIVGFRPNLIRGDGSVPRVDDIHLHHGVWLINGRPTFAAGEEKTFVYAPDGYGWRHRTTDGWVMNHMIHNLSPTPTEVWITYEIDFIPDGAPAAAGLTEVRTQWLDVMGLSIYPVFDVPKGGGVKGRYTYPDQARELRGVNYRRNSWRVEEDGVIVGTAGHLHPGGLWTELWLTRDGRKIRLFRSAAEYFEPAGAVSWDVSMEATPLDWRVGVRRGDVISISATYDSKRASWYESMGIMPLMYSVGGSGPDPFATNVDRPGVLTHGHLAENDNHGGENAGLPDPRRLVSAPAPPGPVRISRFNFGQGDLNAVGRSGRPPTIRPGQALAFVNRDSQRGIMHTITACKSPCNRATGIAYPLADGPVRFDSGNLGKGSEPWSGRNRWSTPSNLSPGTYAYFCRVHPFMRGAFRVSRRAARS